ncbi:hypothetical protein HDV03_003410 [Kappamyces sp. JEL0829]|nr:hypothetical protein HDV03_003410 [Kappamyces sp. JEL0829]
MINIQTDSLYPSLVWQHRLYFSSPGQWETIRIPFRDFVKTSHGFVQKNQLAMDKSQVKTIGFSLLRQPGPFELELAWIKAVNTLDTVGDFDVLKPGQFLDEATGEIRTLRPGEELGRTVPLWEGEKPEMYVKQPKDSTVQRSSPSRATY